MDHEESLPICVICYHEFDRRLHRPWDIGCHALCQACYIGWTGARLCPVCRKPWTNPHVQYELLQACELSAKLLARAPKATAGRMELPNNDGIAGQIRSVMKQLHELWSLPVLTMVQHLVLLSPLFKWSIVLLGPAALLSFAWSCFPALYAITLCLLPVVVAVNLYNFLEKDHGVYHMASGDPTTTGAVVLLPLPLCAASVAAAVPVLAVLDDLWERGWLQVVMCVGGVAMIIMVIIRVVRFVVEGRRRGRTGFLMIAAEVALALSVATAVTLATGFFQGTSDTGSQGHDSRADGAWPNDLGPAAADDVQVLTDDTATPASAWHAASAHQSVVAPWQWVVSQWQSVAVLRSTLSPIQAVHSWAAKMTGAMDGRPHQGWASHVMEPATGISPLGEAVQAATRVQDAMGTAARQQAASVGAPATATAAQVAAAAAGVVADVGSRILGGSSAKAAWDEGAAALGPAAGEAGPLPADEMAVHELHLVAKLGTLGMVVWHWVLLVWAWLLRAQDWIAAVSRQVTPAGWLLQALRLELPAAVLLLCSHTLNRLRTARLNAAAAHTGSRVQRSQRLQEAPRDLLMLGGAGLHLMGSVWEWMTVRLVSSLAVGVVLGEHAAEHTAIVVQHVYMVLACEMLPTQLLLTSFQDFDLWLEDGRGEGLCKVFNHLNRANLLLWAKVTPLLALMTAMLPGWLTRASLVQWGINAWLVAAACQAGHEMYKGAVRSVRLRWAWLCRSTADESQLSRALAEMRAMILKLLATALPLTLSLVPEGARWDVLTGLYAASMILDVTCVLTHTWAFHKPDMPLRLPGRRKWTLGHAAFVLGLGGTAWQHEPHVGRGNGSSSRRPRAPSGPVLGTVPPAAATGVLADGLGPDVIDTLRALGALTPGDTQAFARAVRALRAHAPTPTQTTPTQPALSETSGSSSSSSSVAGAGGEPQPSQLGAGGDTSEAGRWAAMWGLRDAARRHVTARRATPVTGGGRAGSSTGEQAPAATPVFAAGGGVGPAAGVLPTLSNGGGFVFSAVPGAGDGSGERPSSASRATGARRQARGSSSAWEAPSMVPGWRAQLDVLHAGGPSLSIFPATPSQEGRHHSEAGPSQQPPAGSSNPGGVALAACEGVPAERSARASGPAAPVSAAGSAAAAVAAGIPDPAAGSSMRFIRMLDEGGVRLVRPSESGAGHGSTGGAADMRHSAEHSSGLAAATEHTASPGSRSGSDSQPGSRCLTGQVPGDMLVRVVSNNNIRFVRIDSLDGTPPRPHHQTESGRQSASGTLSQPRTSGSGAHGSVTAVAGRLSFTGAVVGPAGRGRDQDIVLLPPPVAESDGEGAPLPTLAAAQPQGGAGSRAGAAFVLGFPLASGSSGHEGGDAVLGMPQSAAATPPRRSSAGGSGSRGASTDVHAPIVVGHHVVSRSSPHNPAHQAAAAHAASPSQPTGNPPAQAL